MQFGTFDISNMTISILMSKMIFIKHLPPVRPKLVPKQKVLRIYWNLAHSVFQICQSWFWCGKLFLLNIYPNCSQTYKCPEFIEIWHIWYFKYTNLDFNVKNDFLSHIYQLLAPNWSQNEKHSEFIEICLNWYFKYASLYFDVKNDFY